MRVEAMAVHMLVIEDNEMSLAVCCANSWPRDRPKFVRE
jgi:hypothetical protein